MIGGLKSDGKWRLREVVVPGTKHVVPDFVTYFMVCHDYNEQRDRLPDAVNNFAKELGYHLHEQPFECPDRSGYNYNNLCQREIVYDSLDNLVGAWGGS